MRLFWVILAILGAGLLLLIATDDAGTIFGIENNAFAGTLYLGLWGAVLAAGIVGSGMRFGAITRSLAIWMFIFLGLVAAYQYRVELQNFASRITAGLVPGSPISFVSDTGGARVMLEKSVSGHFEARVSVNGATLRMLIDTGATSTVLSADDARRAGYDLDALTFRIPVATANGNTFVARERAQEIRIGSIERRDMVIHIAQPGRLNQSLLGMNFINTLSGFDLRGDRIVLSD